MDADGWRIEMRSIDLASSFRLQFRCEQTNSRMQLNLLNPCVFSFPILMDRYAFIATNAATNKASLGTGLATIVYTVVYT